MNAIALFWTGVGLVVVAVVGLVLGLVRASSGADENTRRALAQERAVRAGVAPHTGTVTNVTPQRPPAGADAPRALDTPPQARGATSSRRRGHA